MRALKFMHVFKPADPSVEAVFVIKVATSGGLNNYVIQQISSVAEEASQLLYFLGLLLRFLKSNGGLKRLELIFDFLVFLLFSDEVPQGSKLLP